MRHRSSNPRPRAHYPDMPDLASGESSTSYTVIQQPPEAETRPRMQPLGRSRPHESLCPVLGLRFRRDHIGHFLAISTYGRTGEDTCRPRTGRPTYGQPRANVRSLGGLLPTFCRRPPVVRAFRKHIDSARTQVRAHARAIVASRSCRYGPVDFSNHIARGTKQHPSEPARPVQRQEVERSGTGHSTELDSVHRVAAPTQAKLQRPLRAIATRVTRALKKQGLLLRDDQPPSLNLESVDEFEPLLAASVHYRIATGPHTGRKALTLRTVASNPGTRATSGFLFGPRRRPRKIRTYRRRPSLPTKLETPTRPRRSMRPAPRASFS